MCDCSKKLFGRGRALILIKIVLCPNLHLGLAQNGNFFKDQHNDCFSILNILSAAFFHSSSYSSRHFKEKVMRFKV